MFRNTNVSCLSDSREMSNCSTAHCYSSTAHCYSLTAHCYSSTAHCYSSTAHCYSSTAHCYSSTAHCYSSTAHCYSSIADMCVTVARTSRCILSFIMVYKFKLIQKSSRKLIQAGINRYDEYLITIRCR